MLRRKSKEKKFLKRDVSENIQYYLMMSGTLVLIFLFSYLPLFGIVIAFQKYVPGKPFLGEGVEWVGLKYFKEFVTSYYFSRIMRNTLRLNLMNLVLGFMIPIVFALIVNEIKGSKFRKFTQTVSYLPHFLSIIIVAGMVSRFIADDGIIVMFLNSIGFNIKSLNTSIEAFPWIYTITNIWKNFGWSSILYLATISSIDPGLYEAASIDGAGRLKRIWYITIPEMLPLVMIQLILSIGGMLSSNTDMMLAMYNPSVYESADIIGTYLYREGLKGGQYSYATACGLFMSLLAFILTYIANRISRSKTGFSMW